MLPCLCSTKRGLTRLACSASFGDYDVSHIQEEEELPQVALPVFPPMGQALAELNDEDLKLATLGFGWLASIEGQSPLTELPVVEDTASWSSHTPEPFPSPPDSPCDDDGSASSCCLRREPSMAFSFSTASEASTAATSTHSSNTHHSSILCRARPVRKSSFCENTNFGITRHIIHTRHRDSKALSLLAAPAQGPETQQTIETAASESTATSHHNTLGRPLLAPHLISEYRSPGLHEPHGGLMGLLEEARENGRLQTVTKKNKGLSKWVRSGLRKMKKSSDLRGQARADETLFVLKEPPVKRVPSIDQCLYNN